MPNRITRGIGLFGKIYVGGVALVAATMTVLNTLASAFGTVTFDRAPKIAKKTIAGATLHAGVLNWQNPEAVAIAIIRAWFDVTTKSTGASTTNIGTTEVSATTASDNLIDGVDSGTAAILADNITNAGTNGKAIQKLAAGKWVSIAEASGDATGMVANLYVEYVLV